MISLRVLALLVALLLAVAGLGTHDAPVAPAGDFLAVVLAGSASPASDTAQLADEHAAQACVDPFTDVHGLSPVDAAGQAIAAAVRPERWLPPSRAGPVLEGLRRPPRVTLLPA